MLPTNIITQESDPQLYARLSTAWNSLHPGWVVLGSDHYKVIQGANGSLAFKLRPNRELYDSRSLANYKPSSYNKLDE